MKDIVSASYCIDDISDGIKSRLTKNNSSDLFNRDPRIISDAALDRNFDEETEKEKLIRWGKPQVTLDQVLQEFDLVEETKDKRKENDVTDDILWYAEPAELVE